MNGIQYRIQTYPSYDGKWNLSVKKYVRTTFKRSKRTGWHCQGFVTCDEDLVRYATRAEARAAGNAVKQRKLNFRFTQLGKCRIREICKSNYQSAK